MEKVRLRFKKSQRGTGMISYKTHILNGVKGAYVFIANAEVPVEENEWYDCEVIPMKSKRGFIVTKAERI